MSKAKDLDLFKRSLRGDWQSRMILFQRFLWKSTRVRRFGANCPNIDDFLHDSFTNVLLAGHSYHSGQDFGEWVDSVAAWTALDRQRLRTGDSIRMCAGIEGDEPDNRPRLASYVPPGSGSSDSVAERIAALIGEPNYTLLMRRGVENKTWEDVAAGQPLTGIGLTLVRTVGRLSRFFGAPPPLNDDLEPVFAWAVTEDAAVTHGDPLKPKGRIISMHLDPSFYAPTPEMRAIGLSVPSEVRTIALWDAARASTPPDTNLKQHLENCRYCAELLHSLILMQQALHSDPSVKFLLCPGGFTLVNTNNGEVPAFDRHLAECAVCRQEREPALDRVELSSEQQKSRMRWLKGGGWAAAALILLGGAYLGYKQFSKPAAEQLETQLTLAEAPAPAIAVDTRYKDLAQLISLRDPRFLNSALPRNQMQLYQALKMMESGNLPEGMMLAAEYKSQDPGARLLFGVGLYVQDKAVDGYREVLASEAMSPRNAFRCWATMQCALMIGDMKVVERETDHLASDPEFGPRAKELLARARARH